MTKRVVFEGFTPLLVTAPALAAWPSFSARASALLKCEHEFLIDADAPFDMPIECPACDAESDVSLVRERW